MVHMRGQSRSRPGAQSLSSVAPRGAPGIKGERHESKTNVWHDDHERSVVVCHVEVVDLVQDLIEEGQDEKAVEEAGNDLLQHRNTNQRDARWKEV